MNIGIVTFHCPINYGAILQAKALTLVLEKMGYKCEIINYRLEDDFKSHTSIFEKNANLRSVIKNIIRLFYYKDLSTKIERFKYFYENYLPVTKKIYKSFSELNKEKFKYDIYICGSDQIWRPIKDKFIDKAFYLGFSSASRGIKISYAPSFGTNTFPKELQKEVKELLMDFKAISVREKSGVNILGRIVNTEIKQVIDPTLLISKEEWLNYSNRELLPSKDYIVVYALEKNDLLNECILKLKELTNYKILLISVDGMKRVKYYDEVYYNIGPSEFISLINGANMVLTNSFHGTAFSIIFEKLFISVPHSSTNSRVLDLLSSIGIEDRQIKSSKEIDLRLMKMDYRKIKHSLNELINNSLEYLTNALRIEEKNEEIDRSS
ncbi:polysaccharide pyruvyl transferase family protein [Clostridium sp. CS001]|uniref:polysaccharide pyruvyl transferase family protein n=1 Tax=Clostridium sp. CS001 TaxID=2880648 RepID=UPI001CF31B4B|nr:polysaccharide pyruvyl transferase family protein [Clostridium sp. CS001]MCB2289992.1 polysaccharide pyruvyl transferase family protein [Clostridium sp. CS001]